MRFDDREVAMGYGYNPLVMLLIKTIRKYIPPNIEAYYESE